MKSGWFSFNYFENLTIFEIYIFWWLWDWNVLKEDVDILTHSHRYSLITIYAKNFRYTLKVFVVISRSTITSHSSYKRMQNVYVWLYWVNGNYDVEFKFRGLS